MAEERNVGLARATDSADDADSTKAELQRRMEEARESISQTVTEIKDTVVTQYQQVRENISDSLDWREQYRRHTVPFTLTAFAVGTFIGYSVGGAFGGGGGEDEYDDDDAFDRIEAGFDREVGGARSYAAQPVLGQHSGGAHQRSSSRPRSNAETESAEVFGRGSAESDDVGPETRPSYGGGYEAATAPSQPQGLTAYAAPPPPAAEQGPEEPKGPGLISRFKETKAYDRLQDELSTLGERALEELSRTAQTVVVPALLSKLKDMIGIDLSTQREVAQRSRVEQQTAQTTAQTAAAVAGDASDRGGSSARAAAGGTEGYGAS